jgi:hypothetical protein
LDDKAGSDEGQHPSRDRHPNRVWRSIGTVRRYFEQRRTEKAHETAIDRATRSTKRATWIIAIATIVTGAIAYSQFRIMRGQLDQMQADQRPWVVLNEDIDPKVLNISFVEAGAVANFSAFSIKNIGKSPAFGPLTVSKLTTFATADGDIAGQLRDWCAHLRFIKDIPGVLFPNSRIDDTPASGQPLPWDKITDSLERDGTIYPTILVCIIYKTSAGGEYHHTGFAFDLTKIDRTTTPDSYRGINPRSGLVPMADLHMVKSFFGRSFAD